MTEICTQDDRLDSVIEIFVQDGRYLANLDQIIFFKSPSI